MGLYELREMSNRYGADPNYVLAGGGNTSYKEGNILYIKGSGAALATIQEDQFISLDRTKLASIWQKHYSDDFEDREAAALLDLMHARMLHQAGRPSVETLLHDILPYDYVCHLHPAAVNAMTCAMDGQATAKKLFPDALWVPATMPGYVLAAKMKGLLEGAYAQGSQPHTIFIENHGVFVGGNTISQIDATYYTIMEKLKQQTPSVKLCTNADLPLAAKIAPALRMLLWENTSSYVRYAPFVFHTKEEFDQGLLLTLTPDHMVYCGQEALWIQGDDALQILEQATSAIAAFKARTGLLPRVVAVADIGLFASGGTIASCDAVHDLMLDAASICAKATAFQGAKPMPKHLIDAIGGWEVERYRKNKVLSGAANRMSGKIALVTGGAQGFGLGIAQELCSVGAVCMLADINYEGAQQACRALCETYGGGSASAAFCDVGDEISVLEMIRACALRYGGLDLLVSNAGIVRAGGLDEMTLLNFELSTKVNYTAFFLCAKYAAELMKIQHAYRSEHIADIVQINSKSGLAGSKRNFAYAGAKFGGIGLTQSFALELVEYGIKVNAVCPGNFFDGPLWADPEKGLFVQYLQAKKVDGATTIEDVKRYYEKKVPMGRGCRVIDVVRAILYIVEQEYETGQAVPVTGGQEMLK